MSEKRAVLLTAIVADELEEVCIAIAKEHGAKGVTMLSGRGINFPEHKTFFDQIYRGLNAILLFVLEEQMAYRIADALDERLRLEEPFKGLALVSPLEETGGIDVPGILNYLQNQKESA